MNEKKDILTKTWVVAVLASICCMLWGSAFSCVKIGYSLMNITTNDSGSQLVFGGIRFFVAGLMALAIGSGAERKILLPTKTSIPKIMIISLFQTILQYFFYYIGLAHTSARPDPRRSRRRRPTCRNRRRCGPARRLARP